MTKVRPRIRSIRFMPLILPFVFAVLFFGLLPPRFDAVIYTDNIVGEGSCSTLISSDNESFAYLYQGNAYFGSELKTLKLKDLRYNIDEVSLYMFDVEEADILSFDISIFGITVTHLNSDGLSHPFTHTVSSAVTSSETPLAHIVFDDPEAGESLSLTGFDFIPVWFWIAYFTLIILVSALLSWVFSRLADRKPGIELPVTGAAAIMAALIAGAFFCGSLPYVDYTDFLLNWLILFAVSLLINALTLPWTGSVLVTAGTLAWYIANFYVISFRGKPIMPSDLKAVQTAAEVVDGYSFRPSWQMVAGSIIVIMYCAGIMLVYRRTRETGKEEVAEKPCVKQVLIRRASTAAASVLILVFSVHNPVFASVNGFAWDARVMESFHREGIVLSFLKNAMNSVVKKPEGYSAEVVNGYLNEYAGEEKTEGIRPVRIIMVMNEAFSDLRTVGLDENIDVMPFIDSLEDNVIEGDLYVSVYGGGTCNTEFEALTGNSLAFMGIGAYPYTENVTDPMFSLASYFKDRGYTADAFHPNKATNWNRNMVYPNLGFDSFHDINDYVKLAEPEYLHDLPADAWDYDSVNKVSEMHNGDAEFLFDVTVQNHSGYSRFLDVEEDSTVKEYGSQLGKKARVYLSLVKASDDELKELVEKYRDSDEPTMIVFFGDHQPGLDYETQKDIYTTVQNNLDYFKTKFFIWTNYDTEAVHDVSISANYLPWLILERGNFDLPPYIQMLKEVHEKYPVISSQGVMDSEGNVYSGVGELADDPLITKYRNIQYANIFDKIDSAWFETAK